MSSQPAVESSQLSGGIVEKLISVFYGRFDELSQTQQSEVINTVTFVVRKSAHFFEYFILGALSVLFVNSLSKTGKIMSGLIAALFCVIYAFSDEIHQYFVPGRACRVSDVLIDTSGSAVAVILILTLLYVKCHKQGELNAKKEID